MTNDNKEEILVTVFEDQVKERYNKMQNSSKSKIIPVIKNNCNGLQFEHMIKLFEEIGCEMVATSYAKEFYLKAKDSNIKKLSWTWFPDDKYKEVKNLELCCKNFEQLEFCIDNNIPYHIVFNLMMNRGGFKIDDIERLIEFLTSKNADKNLIITAHCPYEDQKHIDEYIRLVELAKKNIEKLGFNVSKIHCANGELFMKDKRTHYQMCRIGTPLLLPQHDKFSKRYNPIEISSYIADIMEVKKGGNIGYNALHLREDKTCAVVPVGYYNFEGFRKVKIIGDDGSEYYCKVLNMMHDTMILDVSNVPKNNITTHNKVVLLDFDTFRFNWKGGMARTFKLNPDMVKYKFV